MRAISLIMAAGACVAFCAVVGDVRASITPGDLVVYRVGDGASALVNTGAKVFVDEYTSAGVLVQSIEMPSTGAGAKLVASGVATSEGFLTVSPNGRYVALTGYNSTLPASGSISGVAGITRTVAVIDSVTGSTSYTTLSDFASGNNPRSAVTDDGNNLWMTGGAGGVRYATVGAATSTQLSTTLTNLRQVNIFGGQLYASDSSGSAVRLGAVGTGTPTTTGQTITNIPGFATAGSPYAFFFADLSSSVAGLDTLFVADDGIGLEKFSLVGGVWTANGVVGIAADAYRGLTGLVNPDGSVSLFSTRKGGAGATGGGELVFLSDASGYNGAFGGVPSVLATAANQEAFRGVGIITPAPGAAVLLGLGGLIAGRRRRA